MSIPIGKKMTFWDLIQNKIIIPTLQRDYIYGAKTEKTDEVLENMLQTFSQALSENKEETLDFVYGSESKAKEFMPLDGQQRLTTLFLLHFYAALISKIDDQYAASKEDFDKLSGFSYATRNCTIAFCNNLLIGKHEELRQAIKTDAPISEYLKNLDEFRGSFYTDPSIMSMLVVLDRIHKKFHKDETLWSKLTAPSCPINFYMLDFGRFDLSDDLYNKMNSRGKPLTNFEVLKAKIHKLIKELDPTAAETIAVKLDTNWMQFVWETLNRTSNLKDVDPSYMWLLKNLFRTLDYVSGYGKQRFPNLDDNCINANMGSPSRIKAMEDILDILSSKSNLIPDEIKEEYNTLISEAVKADIRYNSLLKLYAIYLGLKYELQDTNFCYLFRHVLNLINNSSDFIREENMRNLLIDVKCVMRGKLLSQTSPLILNKNSWNEEQEKERHREVWKKLFKYEDIDEINGTVQAFCVNLNETGTLDLGNVPFTLKLIERLEKAYYFFTQTSKMDESDRRAILLSLGNYAMSSHNNSAYLYFGIIKGSWQNFTGYHRYNDRQRIMEVFDKIDISRPLERHLSVSTENWRYYAIKYAKDIAVAYRSNDYGYIYFPQIENPTKSKGHLDAVILQSRYYSNSNVAWKLIHKVLYNRHSDKYNFFLDSHGGHAFILSKINNDVELDMGKNGWRLTGLSSEVLNEVGIRHKEMEESENDAETSERSYYCLIEHSVGSDYVDEGKEILEKLSIKFPELKKND